MVQAVVKWGRDRWGRDRWRVRGAIEGGKVETSQNVRVCSGVRWLIWVGYWGTDGRWCVKSALVCTVYVLDGDGVAAVAYSGVLNHTPTTPQP